MGCALICLARGDWETGLSRIYEARDQPEGAGVQAAALSALDRRRAGAKRLRAAVRAGPRRHDPVLAFCAGVRRARPRRDVAGAAADAAAALDACKASPLQASTTRRPIDGKPMRWLPLMSAPGVLGVRPDNMPARVPYLAAEPARVERWARLARRRGIQDRHQLGSRRHPRMVRAPARHSARGLRAARRHPRRAADLAAERPAVAADRARAVRRPDRGARRPIPIPAPTTSSTPPR